MGKPLGECGFHCGNIEQRHICRAIAMHSPVLLILLRKVSIFHGVKLQISACQFLMVFSFYMLMSLWVHPEQTLEMSAMRIQTCRLACEIFFGSLLSGQA